MVTMAILLAAMVYLVYWWVKEGSTGKELFLFLVLELLLSCSCKASAARIVDLTNVRWVVGAVKGLPTAMWFIAAGCFVADMLWFQVELDEEFGEERRGGISHEGEA